jgi:hypothetical protein
MGFARKARWSDWFREMFLRQGLFSLRPMTVSDSERETDAAPLTEAKDIIRLNLDPESTRDPLPPESRTNQS